MATKRKNPKRVAAGKKAAAARKRNARKPVRRSLGAKRRTYKKRRKSSGSVKQKNMVMGRVKNIGAGMGGAAIYVGSNLIWKPQKLGGKILKTVLGSVALSFLSGSMSAGFAGAGVMDIGSSALSLGAGSKRRLRACGKDNLGQVVLRDSRSGAMYMMDPNTKKYRQVPKQYQQQYNKYYPMS